MGTRRSDRPTRRRLQRDKRGLWFDRLDDAQLDDWLDRFATATTLDDLQIRT